MSENFWRNLVQTVLDTTENEISCDECFEVLDEYVDLLESGQDPTLVLPNIEQHLSVCHCCHTELEALITAVKLAVEENTPPAKITLKETIGEI